MKALVVLVLLELSSQIDAQGRPCLSYPPAPTNSKRSCRLNTCTLTCLPEYQFPDGSTFSTMSCKDGDWIPTNNQWTKIPDCQKTCTPPCINGGTCLSYDTCQCPQAYRGEQCQYREDVCTADKLNFNGNYQCRGNTESFKCSVTCPEGIEFNRAPEESYTCQYHTGRFDNTPPSCDYGDDVDIVTTNKEKRYILTIVNVTRMHNGNEVILTVPEYIEIENRDVMAVKLEPSVCFLWGDGNIKTFDGRIFSANSNCEEILANDLGGTWSITTNTSPDNYYRLIHIRIGNNDYTITKSDQGRLIVSSQGRQYTIPTELDLIKIDIVNESVVIQLKYLGVTVKWDTEKLVQVEISEKLIRSTGGLCGFPDGNPENDLYKDDGNEATTLTEFLESWSIQKPCNGINEIHACTGLGDVQTKATNFCQKLLTNPKFQDCFPLLEVPELMNACTWDYCKCKKQCACVTLNVVNRNCLFYERTNNSMWRDPETCPMQCTGGKVYMTCEPEGGQPTCGSPGRPNTSGVCFDGCYCPVDTYLHNGECISKAQCPCMRDEIEHAPGGTVPDECNTCTCTNGEWSCTEADCRVSCYVHADPHYKTFDGKFYDFMGLCNYYLLKLQNNISIEGENAKWLNTPASITKSVIIKIFNQRIKLKQNRVVEVNGVDINKLPAYIPGATIKTYSSEIITVILYNDIEIRWDGVYNADIFVPKKFMGHTSGLCGTYNNNVDDDFQTPSFNIETDSTAFGNSWITGERCNDVAPKPVNTCEKKANKDFATKHCNVLKSNLFSKCHKVADVTPHYENCLYDMCTCAPHTKCLCPMLSSYATLCSKQGIMIDWVNQVSQCSANCDAGQNFQSCSNPCKRTCGDISAGNCRQQCVEGCTCPDGQTLNENNQCIPINQCKCQYNGMEFSAGFKEIRLVATVPSLCECKSAIWNCRPATKEELITFPESKGKCDMANNFEFTNCRPVEPTTCQNMLHVDGPIISTGICKPGCQCQNGFVLNRRGNKCIKPLECVCEDSQGVTVSSDALRKIYEIIFSRSLQDVIHFREN